MRVNTSTPASSRQQTVVLDDKHEAEVASRFMFLHYYLAIQRSVWRDIKFAFCLFFCLFVCTVEDISTQDGAIGVKFWLRVEQTPGTGTR